MLEFQPMASHEGRESVLLLLGETIPDLPDVRVGGWVEPADMAKMGYDEYAHTGGWIIWNDCADWFCVGKFAPLGWFPIPQTGGASGLKLAKRPAQVLPHA